jgi:hypothetical protein
MAITIGITTKIAGMIAGIATSIATDRIEDSQLGHFPGIGRPGGSHANLPIV